MNELEKIAAHNAELRECIELAESLPSVPQGTIEITDNGSFDVANYERVEVSVIGKLPNLIMGETGELTEKDFGNATKLRTYAFYAGGITKAELPDTIETFESYAFCWNSRMKSIKLPKNCHTIKSYVFNNCYSLTKLELPDTLVAIGNRAFSDMHALRELRIPNGVTELLEGVCWNNKSMKVFDLTDYGTDKNFPTLANVSAFQYTPTDMKILVPIGRKSTLAGMTNWSSFANQIIEFGGFDVGTVGLLIDYSSDGTGLVCSGWDEYADIEIPPYIVIPKDDGDGNDILGVTEYAFSGNTQILRVYLNNVKNIGAYAFQNCTSLTYIDAPNVTEIGRDAFTKSGIINIELPELLWPANDVFVGCASLKRANLGKANNIANYCFTNCTSFDTLILPNPAKVTTLANTNAFSGSTPIANGTGYIYVPRALIDSYKTATNWSVFANQFRALEDYPNI